MGGNGMKGMDVERGAEVVGQIGVRIEMEETRITALEAIKAALEANWHGADSQMMIERVSEAIELDRRLIEALEGKKTELQTDVDEQTTTSSQ